MTMTTDFYDGLEGAMTPEQAAQALWLAEQGDTGAGAPTGNASPTDAFAVQQSRAEEPPSSGPELTADTAVVLAKDGRHTIPFEHFERARQEGHHWQAVAQAEQAQRQAEVAQLTEALAQAQARADAGQAPTRADNLAGQAEAAIAAGASIDLFGDFSEEAIVAGISAVISQKLQTEVQAQVDRQLNAKASQQSAVAAHFGAIYEAHPNADSILQSAEFADWVNRHPTAARNALWQTFDGRTGGTATEVIEVFDAYSKATGQSASTPTEAARIRAAVQAASAHVPSSLSSIPGGRAAGNGSGLSGDMNGSDLYMALEGKSRDQIEAFLNRNI